MGLYKQKWNPLSNSFNLVPLTDFYNWKAGVDTVEDLEELEGNVKGDARIVNSNHHLYIYDSSEWQDMGDVVDLKWAAIEDKPDSSIEEIDDAVENSHASESDNQTAETVPTEETGVSVQDKIDELDETAHAHANKTVLDQIQEAFTTVLKAIYDAVVDAFDLHKDATENVHGMETGEEIASVQDIAIDENLSLEAKDALSKKHTRNTDQYLDFGGENQIQVTEITKKLLTNVTYYVNCDTGDDSNPGTSDLPFKTIQKAIDLIPDNLRWSVFYIKLQSSLNYNEGIFIAGKSNGRIDISSVSGIPDDVLFTRNDRIFTPYANSAGIFLTGISMRVTANNKECIYINQSWYTKISNCKFGDNDNFGTRGITADKGNLVVIENCSDLDDKKCVYGIESRMGSYCQVIGEPFGDDFINAFGNGFASHMDLVGNTRIYNGTLTIDNTEYDDAILKKHEQHSDDQNASEILTEETGKSVQDKIDDLELLSHTQNKDTKLDEDGENEVTVGELRGHLDDGGNPHGTLAKEINTEVGGKTVEGRIEDLEDDKADKVAEAIDGNFAALDAEGNLVDSGNAVSDFEEAGAVSTHEGTYVHGDIAHTNRTDLDKVSGENTGDQDLSGLEEKSNKGNPNGYASLDGSGKIPVTQLPNSIMTYQGTWDASINIPELSDGMTDATAGDVYRVSVAGTQDLGSGEISFEVGDYIIYNGSIWQKADTTDAVSQINGKVGEVELIASDIPTDETNETVQDKLDELDSGKEPANSNIQEHITSTSDPHKEKEILIFKCLADDEVFTVGDGKFRFVIPSALDGMNLIEAHAHIYVVSSSGLPSIAIFNETTSHDILSVNITIDVNEYDSKNAETQPTINPDYDNVNNGDVLRVDVDAAGTDAKGLEVRLTFQKP